MERDETKLPQWVRDRLNALRADLDVARRTLAIASNQAALNSTGKVIADSLGVGVGFPLHDRAAIDFKLPSGKITVMIRGNALDLNSSGGALLVHPSASNSVQIIVDNDWGRE